MGAAPPNKSAPTAASTAQAADATALLTPERLWTSSEVLGRPSPVPTLPGVYVWYFSQIPTTVPVDSCHRHDDSVLLYAGISPKAPPRNGGTASRQSLRSRVRYHFRGNAEGSTLRLTLGCLLSQELGIELRRVGSGTRMTFGKVGEATLSQWMATHARVAWVAHARPWEFEHQFIQTADLPLNLDQNRNHFFHGTLSALRAAQRARARSLPVTA